MTAEARPQLVDGHEVRPLQAVTEDALITRALVGSHRSRLNAVRHANRGCDMSQPKETAPAVQPTPVRLRRKTPVVVDAPLEVGLAVNVTDCGTCAFFWPEGWRCAAVRAVHVVRRPERQRRG